MFFTVEKICALFTLHHVCMRKKKKEILIIGRSHLSSTSQQLQDVSLLFARDYVLLSVGIFPPIE